MSKYHQERHTSVNTAGIPKIMFQTFVRVMPLELPRVGKLLFVPFVNVSPSLRYIWKGPTRNHRQADSHNCRKSCSSLNAVSSVPDISRNLPGRSDCTRRGSIRNASCAATTLDCNSWLCFKILCTFHTRVHTHLCFVSHLPYTVT